MRSQGTLESDLLADDLQKLYPIMEPECSDSGNFDNALEFLLMTGRTLQEAVLLMVPEAWQKHKHMAQAKRDFTSTTAASWSRGTARLRLPLLDGKYIGAVLDNGLRPSRHYETHDRVIMASEVGTIPVDPANVRSKGRLQPGRLFLVDFEQGRIVPDDEIKSEFAAQRPYGEWIKNQRIELDDIAAAGEAAGLTTSYRQAALARRRLASPPRPAIHVAAAGTRNAIRLADEQRLPALMFSDKPRMIYDCPQLFAQVINPAIDSRFARSSCRLVTSGRRKITPRPPKATRKRLRMPHPI